MRLPVESLTQRLYQVDPEIAVQEYVGEAACPVPDGALTVVAPGAVCALATAPVKAHDKTTRVLNSVLDTAGKVSPSEFMADRFM